MRIKFLLGSVLSLMISVSAIAQNTPGIDLLRLGELDLAKQYFIKVMRQAPADSYYYLGEIAWAEGNMAEAKDNYEKALNSNPESGVSQVGVAKAQLKTNEKEAKKLLQDIAKKNKKDVSVILEVARAFYDNGMTAEGDKAIADARKADKTSPLIYILEGDRMVAAGKHGDAAMQYDQAINFDNQCELAYIKGAKVYEGINFKTAIQQYRKAMEIDPKNTLVHRYLGKMYSTNGYHPEAVAVYNEYFANGNYNMEDLSNYAISLYFTKDYAKARGILEEGLKRESENFVMNRLLMYSENELKNFDATISVGEKLFTLRTDSGYLAQDYLTYGNALSEVGRKEDAFAQYKKAIELDPSKVDMYKDIATTCAAEKMFEEAASFMQGYIDNAGDAVEASDFYTMGNYYQSAGRALTEEDQAEERARLLQKADESFTVVTERLPDNYLGYYARANANALMDPDLKQGLSKPFYEKMLEIIVANDEVETRKNIVLTAYEYLSVLYYYDFADNKSAASKAKAKEYCEKYSDLKPDNANIQAILEAVQ